MFQAFGDICSRHLKIEFDKSFQFEDRFDTSGAKAHSLFLYLHNFLHRGLLHAISCHLDILQANWKNNKLSPKTKRDVTKDMQDIDSGATISLNKITSEHAATKPFEQDMKGL